MTTTFHSTRSTTDSLDRQQAIRKGIADDGGLFVSDALGKTKVDVASCRGRTSKSPPGAGRAAAGLHGRGAGPGASPTPTANSGPTSLIISSNLERMLYYLSEGDARC